MTLQSQGNAAPQDAIGREIARRAPWFHNLHLPSGHQTAPDHPLGDFPAFKWAQVAPHLPHDLAGWRALDIGCNAGFYTFELARRGADVLGIDLDDHYLEQARWAADVYGVSDRVRFRRMQVYDLARTGDRFDLILFMGVLYHLRYPLLALDAVAARVDRLLVFQTLEMLGEDVAESWDDIPFNRRDVFEDRGWPKMAFVERSFANDPTNWWVPNHAAVEAMARTAGLEVVARPGDEIYLCRAHGLPADVRQEFDAALGR